MEFWEKPLSLDDFDILYHSGIKHQSGRYVEGTGENPYQHCRDFGSRHLHLKHEHPEWGRAELAAAMGCKSSDDMDKQLRAANAYVRATRIQRANAMHHQGADAKEIATKLSIELGESIPVSTVRGWLSIKQTKRQAAAEGTMKMLREQVGQHQMIDISEAAGLELGISDSKLRTAVKLLCDNEGYEVRTVKMKQVSNSERQSDLNILVPPGFDKTNKEIHDNIDKVMPLTDVRSTDNGMTFQPKFVYPASMDSSRLHVRYADEKDANGHLGIERDGLIEIRPGVKDLSLGNAAYAQVRILVDDTHYLKGMAIYSNNLPDGVDVVFNTNKPSGTPVTSPDPKASTVLKAIKKDDPLNPFNSVLRNENGQSYYTDDNGERKLSLINKTREEGDWNEWAKKLPSQFLAKQPMELIKKQLSATVDETKQRYDDILGVSNDSVRRKMLEDFADECETTAVHLTAQALPGQRYQVLLPLPACKDNEIYAPNFKDGETVALIRYPHAGPFEIPILKVNNKLPQGKEYLGESTKSGKFDAVGISKATLDILSGADTDGDTAMVIPCNDPDFSSTRIMSSPPLEALKNFNIEEKYGYYPGATFKLMPKKSIQREMGQTTNLLTDMTSVGAPLDEVAQVVKHSMVVIDAHKHKYDYKQSEKDNHIEEFREKYQGKHLDIMGNEVGGAATIFSRAKHEIRVPKRKGSGHTDRETGDKVYKLAPDSETHYIDKNGKEQVRVTKVEEMREAKDARELVRGWKEGLPVNEKEMAYAEYANTMKQMARDARLAAVSIPAPKQNVEAKIKYAAEVESLTAKLEASYINKPHERMAQRIATSEIRGIVLENPQLKESKEEYKKVKDRALKSARAAVGAKRQSFEITEKEWEAINNYALKHNTVNELMLHAKPGAITDYALPPKKNTLTAAEKSRIVRLARAHPSYTPAKLAEAVGVTLVDVQMAIQEANSNGGELQ